MWEIGISLYLVAFSSIYICQIGEIGYMNKFIGITKYDLDNWLLPVRLFGFILPFISAIFVRRQLINKQNELSRASDSYQNDEQFENKSLLLYIRFKERLNFLWPIVDFFARSNFIVLSFAIVVLAIHWKLSVASLIYLAVVCTYYLLLPFKLVSSKRQRFNEEYQQLDDNVDEDIHGEHYQQPDVSSRENIKSLIDISETEDIKNKKIMIRCRYWVNGAILIFT